VHIYKFLYLLFGTLLSFCYVEVSSSAERQPVVPPEYERDGGPYVPTPNIVVDRMLSLAQVRAGDHVIDLGSGDGVIVITAATKYELTAYGVDIDEELIRLSNLRAKNLGINQRVLFEVKDIFKTDLSKASVVTLYLLPEMMERLESKLYSELQPGTRIVSHDYFFPNWKHSAQVDFSIPEKEFISGVPHAYLYLWVVPAKVVGNWAVQFNSNNHNQLRLSQNFQNLSGDLLIDGQSHPLIYSQLMGNQIKFEVIVGADRLQFSGNVEGEKISGELLRGNLVLPWFAQRQ